MTAAVARPASAPAGMNAAGADSAATAMDPVLACVLYALERLERPMSAAAFRSRVSRPSEAWTLEDALEAVESLGFVAELDRVDLATLDHRAGPWILETREGPRVVHPSSLDEAPRIFDPAAGGGRPGPSGDLVAELGAVYLGRALSLARDRAADMAIGSGGRSPATAGSTARWRLPRCSPTCSRSGRPSSR